MNVMDIRIDLKLERERDLRYGENPHQQAMISRVNGYEFPLNILQGKEVSYTNLLDLDAAWKAVNQFVEPACVVVKHTNPCGAAIGESVADAYIRARDADSLAAFGGIAALNRTVDPLVAMALVSTFVECVIAPDVDEAAKAILAEKPKMRVITCNQTRFGYEFHSVFGCMLVQEPDMVAEAISIWPTPELRVVTKRQPTAHEWEALRFAWRICAGVKSNAVIFTGKDQTLAIGCGQMSRVDSVNVAVMKAEDRDVSLVDSVAASDAFFPFRDGLDAVAKAGATAVVQPGGSQKDQEVIEAADEHDMAMVFTGFRHFRH
jgi:phosphoribosylaminoimidazolecarboxamide formyltransferase/IMP cyclohydrolase